MGKKIKGWKRTKILKILHFLQLKKIVFDYYNAILHCSDYIYAIFIIYGVENQMIIQPGKKGNQWPGGEEI